MNITKSAPLPERPCEQLTRCALCVCDPKHKHGNDSRYQAGGQCNYPLGSMPRCCNSLRIIRFIQAARESSPSCCCAFSIFSRKSGSKRNWNGGLPRLSFLCVDTLTTPHVMYLCVVTHYTQSTQKAKPAGAMNTNGLLTNNVKELNAMAVIQHTPRPAHTQTAFVWSNRFHDFTFHNQPGGRFLVAFNRRGYFSTKASRANFSGGTKRGAGGGIFVLVSSSSSLAQASDCLCRMISSSCVCVSCIGDSVLLVMILPCKAMRRSTSHHGADSFYPLGSMPRCCNSLRRTRLIQVAKDVSPSALAASSSCALKSSGNRIWYGGERFSNGVDTVITLHYYTYMVITIVLAITQKSTPRSAGNTYGASNQQRKLGAVMVAVNHIPHLVHTQTAFVWRFLALSAGEKNQLIASVENSYDSRAPHKTGAGILTPLEIKAIHDAPASFFVSTHTHTLSMVGCMGPTSVGLVPFIASCENPVQSTASELLTSCGGYIPTIKEAANMATIPTLVHSQTAFLWRFIAFGASDHQIIHVTAWTEREARSRCPSGCVAVFAARIRQGETYAQ